MKIIIGKMILSVYHFHLGARGDHVDSVWCQSRSVERWHHHLSVPDGQSAVPRRNSTAAETVLRTHDQPSARVGPSALYTF